MNELLDKQLVEKYPKIFRDRYSNMKVTAMCWGFEHGDGWYNILDALCSNIQHHTDWLRKKRASALKLNRKIKKAIELNSIEPIINHHKGDWWVERCEKILAEKKYEEVPNKVNQVVASQVKEKFGSLRFYWGISSEDKDWEALDENISRTIYEIMGDIAHSAESRSSRICEDCGKFGTTTVLNYWYRTLCPACSVEQGYTEEKEDI